MQLISLFSGIGGFELAAEWMGWQNIVSCEINHFGRKVLKHYWPDAYHHDDIHTLTYEKIKHKIDPSTPVILTGGFPCQPYSAAGKRLGKEDERHLWPEMLRIIREVKPTWIVGENVLGLVNWNGGLVFHEVQTDLEAEGYEVQPYVLPACAVNAPHRRDRVWFVAYAKDFGSTVCKLGEKRPGEQIQAGGYVDRFESMGSATDSDSAGISRQSVNTRASETIRQGRESIEKIGNFGYIGTWSTFPTQSPICTGDDGISSELDGITFSKWRNESIKAAGNAIVPQVVYQIFKCIDEYNNLLSL